MPAQTAHKQTVSGRSSIGRHLVVLVVTVATLTAVSMAAGLAWLETSRDADAEQREITGVAHALAETLAEPLESGDRAGVLQALRALSRLPDFTQAMVEDAAGREVESLGNTMAPRNYGGGILPFHRTIQSAVPIRKNGARIGTLTVLVTPSGLLGHLASGLFMGFGAAVLSALAGLVIARRLQRRITDPIERLTKNMWHVRETNDFARTLAHHSQGETGALIDAFNDMLAQIHARDERLALHRAQLEQTVQLRTRDLRAAEALCASKRPAVADSAPAQPAAVYRAEGASLAETTPIETGPPAEDLPVIDEEDLAAAVGGDVDTGSELVMGVLGLFEAHAPEALLKLALSARNGGAGDIAEAAHALTSMARNIGARRLAQTCDALEGDARAERIGDLPDRLEALKRDLVEVLQAIGGWRSTGSEQCRSGSPHHS